MTNPTMTTQCGELGDCDDHDALVDLARRMRDLGVVKFSVGNVVVEIHQDAALRASAPPLEAGELEDLRAKAEASEAALRASAELGAVT